MDRNSFERRMENWRRTVSGSTGPGSNCCAAWAALYVASRLRDGSGNDAPDPPREIVSVDQLDGWLVEAAVRAIPVFELQQVLRFWWVRRYPEHWIKSKLMIRRGRFRLILGRAENALQRVLDRLENPTKIPHNNLHAGNVPRPESTDCPVGAVLTLESGEALIE